MPKDVMSPKQHVDSARTDRHAQSALAGCGDQASSAGRSIARRGTDHRWTYICHGLTISRRLAEEGATAVNRLMAAHPHAAAHRLGARSGHHHEALCSILHRSHVSQRHWSHRRDRDWRVWSRYLLERVCAEALWLGGRCLADELIGCNETCARVVLDA